VALRETLTGVEPLKAADVEEEVKPPVVGRLQARDVAHEVGHSRGVLVLGCFDRGRHDVDAYGVPPSAREFGSELATATAQIKRTAERPVALSLLAVQHSRDAGCGRLPVTLPGRDPEAVQAEVVRHAAASLRRAIMDTLLRATEKKRISSRR